VFCSVDHGGEIRIVAVLHECRYTHTHTHTHCCIFSPTDYHQYTHTHTHTHCCIFSPSDYHHHFTLDLNTDENGEITDTDTDLWYADRPDSFDDECSQVLCRESVCGRCYWEIEWNGYVDISVSYKSISRNEEGEEFVFGSSDQSWSLCCSPSSYSFRHNNIRTALPVDPISWYVYYDDDDADDDADETLRQTVRVDVDDDDDLETFSRTIGVYVDPSAGTLSFYSVEWDTIRHTSLIHTVQTTFTQPLYPGFRVYNYGSSVKLLKSENRL